VDLGVSPVANAMLSSPADIAKEKQYPLHAYVCETCLLVQLPTTIPREKIFNDAYTYFSSYSPSWLNHARQYVDMAADRFSLSRSSFVVELASNDGYLLEHFVKKGIPVLGIDPSANVAQVAVKKGIPTRVAFFGKETAKKLAAEGKKADLIVANNVLAHVPDINDFVAGIRELLKPDGIVTAEFPHLVNLIEKNQFDTIYHEHYSYFSFIVIEKIFAHHGITLFNVEKLPTHGGSLRIYGKRTENSLAVESSIGQLLAEEEAGGYTTLAPYLAYGASAAKVKHDFLQFLQKAKHERTPIVGYGAAAKGNTFLNYCGVGLRRIDYVVDKSPHKQGMLLPGSHIPVYAPDKIKQTKPDYVLILPWNLKEEIARQLSYISAWGGTCVVAIPKLTVLDHQVISNSQM